MEPLEKLELTPEEQEAEARDAALMALARAMGPPPSRPFHELFPGAIAIPDLHYWSSLGKVFKVKIALNNGSDINEVGPFGTTPLHEAAAEGHLEVVRLLVEQGADVTARSSSGQTAVELASAGNHAAVVEYLQSVGA